MKYLFRWNKYKLMPRAERRRDYALLLSSGLLKCLTEAKLSTVLSAVLVGRLLNTNTKKQPYFQLRQAIVIASIILSTSSQAQASAAFNWLYRYFIMHQNESIIISGLLNSLISHVNTDNQYFSLLMLELISPMVICTLAINCWFVVEMLCWPGIYNDGQAQMPPGHGRGGVLIDISDNYLSCQFQPSL